MIFLHIFVYKSVWKTDQGFLSMTMCIISKACMCIKYFGYKMNLLHCVLCNAWFFLELFKRLALIRSHDSPTNTIFFEKNLSLPWFLSWNPVLRSITLVRNIKEVNLSFTLEMCVHRIYSISENPTGPTFKNISGNQPNLIPSLGTMLITSTERHR